MSEDTPECAKLHHLKKYFSPEHAALAVCSKTRRPHSLKMIPRCLNMDLRPCPRVTYALDISVQAMRFLLPFLLTIYILIFTLLMRYY